jgi:serine/threonine protein kinase
MPFDFEIFKQKSEKLKNNLNLLKSTRYSSIVDFISDWQQKANDYLKNPSNINHPLINEEVDARLEVTQFLIHLSTKAPITPEEIALWDFVQNKLTFAKEKLPELHRRYYANMILNRLRSYNKKRRKSISGMEVKADHEKAKEFFEKNPGERFCGMTQGTVFSYFKTSQGDIFQRSEELGKGTFGRTKVAINIDTGEKIALKRHLNFSETSIQIEAAINLDLGVAVTPLEIRKKNGQIYKVYQGMKNLGRSMKNYFAENSSVTLQERIDYSILLLQKVHELHTGSASKAKTPYAHGDIKPANICLDDAGCVHLIDFGFTKHRNLHAAHYAESGTQAYLPINITKNPKWYAEPPVQTPSYFFDDKIACLRTIHHQAVESMGFLTKAQFNSLPTCVQDVLKSDDINKCIALHYSIESIAAVLSYFQCNHNCQEAEVAQILASSDLSQKMIAKYQSYTSEEKSNIVLLMQNYPLSLTDLLDEEFIHQLPCLLEIHRKKTTGEDVVAYFHSNLQSKSLLPYFASKLMPIREIAEEYIDENFWKAFLQDSQPIIKIDEIDRKHQPLIAKAFENIETRVNSTIIKALKQRGVIVDAQILIKPQLKHDLDIFPVQEYKEYWKGVIENQEITMNELLKLLRQEKLVHDDILSLIIQNFQLNSALVQELCKKPNLSPRILSELIPKVFVERLDKDCKLILLKYLANNKTPLSDDAYAQVGQLDREQFGLYKAQILKDECNSPKRFMFLYENLIFSDKGYLVILHEKNDISLINQCMTKVLWEAYLKEEVTFGIDFSQLNEYQIGLISQAFNESTVGLNVGKVKSLKQKGMIGDEQILQKSQFKFNFDIFPIPEYSQYWKGVLENPQTPAEVLLKLLQHRPFVEEEYIQLILQNHRPSRDLMREICNNPNLSSNTINQLISILLTEGSDKDSQWQLLVFLKSRNYSLTDEQYQMILDLKFDDKQKDLDKRIYLANQCLTTRRLELLCQRETFQEDAMFRQIISRNFVEDEKKLELIRLPEIGDKIAHFILTTFTLSDKLIQEIINIHPLFEQDLEILPLQDYPEHWKKILENPRLNRALVQKILNIPVLSKSIMASLISNIFVEGGDKVNQWLLHNYIYDHRVTLTDEQYQMIVYFVKTNISQRIDPLYYLYEQCNTPQRFIWAYLCSLFSSGMIDALLTEIFPSDESKLPLIQSPEIGEKVSHLFLTRNRYTPYLIREIIKAHPEIHDDELFKTLLEKIPQNELDEYLNILLVNCKDALRLEALMNKLEKIKISAEVQEKILSNPHFHLVKPSEIKIRLLMEQPRIDFVSRALDELTYGQLLNCTRFLPKDTLWQDELDKAEKLYDDGFEQVAKDILSILLKMHHQKKNNGLNELMFHTILVPHQDIREHPDFNLFWDKFIEISFGKEISDSLKKHSIFKARSETMLESLKENIVPTPKKN